MNGAFRGAMYKSFLLMPVALMLIVVQGSSTQVDRTRCCHGCGGYHCNHKNCGDICNSGPSVQRLLERLWTLGESNLYQPER